MRRNNGGIIRIRKGREHRLLPVMQGVAASSTAFLDLPLGVTYEAIHIVYAGTTMDVSHMAAIRIIANGQTIHNISGTIRDVLNQFDKMQAAATNKVLDIPFQRNALKDGADLHTGLATLIKCKQAPFGISSLRLEIDIDGGAVAPTIQVYATVRRNDACESLALLRVENFSETVPALSNAEYQFTKKYNLDALRPLLARLTLVKANTEVTAFRMQQDRKDVVNRTSKLNEFAQTKAGLRAPQSGYVIFDTGEDGYSHPMRLADVADFAIYTTVANGSYNMVTVAETLGSIGDA